MQRAYELRRPERQTTAFVFASPHSGCHYTRSFVDRSELTLQALRSSEDAFVDELFDGVPLAGAPLLSGVWPRAWLDVNRAPDELDPALIEGLPRGPHNPRVASGLGVVPRVVAGGRAIYRGKIPRAEVEARLRDVWHPYHRQLSDLMSETLAAFGQSVLIDCHSMPREALDGISVSGRRPDVVIGDRFGVSAAPQIVAVVEDAFRREGLAVSRNAPFAGAYVTQTYGRPARGRHAVQVELNRGLYMDEKRLVPRADFTAFKQVIDRVVADLCDAGRPAQQPLAAE